MPCPETGTRRRRILYCTTNRYRTYNQRNYETLADAFDLRVLWVSPPPANEPLPPSLQERIQWWVVGDDVSRLTARDVARSADLFRIAYRESRSCDLVIAPPAGSWKTRVLYAAAKLNGVPLAVRSDTWREGDGLLRTRARSSGKGLASHLQRRLTEHIERDAAGLLVNGSKGDEYLRARGISADQIFTFRRLHPDLAELPLDHALVAELRRQKGERLAFLYLGRVMQQKGVVPLIRAFRSMLKAGRDAVLFIVGGPITKDTGRGRLSTDYYEEARRLAAPEPRIIFTGQVSPAAVHNYYAATDVFVHPHVATYDGQDVHEPWGNVITEAACMSMPIVVTDRIPAAFDLVENDVNGALLGTDRLEEGLATSLARFIDDPARVTRFGEASRRRFEAFADPRVNNDALNRVIDRVRDKS